MKTSCYTLVFIIGCIQPILAQYGKLDSTFNLIGRVTTEFPLHSAHASSGSLQSDGKIIAAGTVQSGNNAYFGAARYNSNGTLDTTFGVDGKAIIQVGTQNRDHVRALGIQPDDKIIIAGITLKDTNSQIALIRLSPNGMLDSTFGINGVTILALEGRGNNGTSIAIQQDGSIFLAGYTSPPNTDALVCRFTPDGQPDSSFGIFGKVVTAIPWLTNGANAIAIQRDGKVVTGGFVGFAHNGVAVYDFSLLRFYENGILDSTFNMDGIVKTSIGQWADQLNGLAIQSDGKIVAAGHTNSGDPNHQNLDFVVARYNEDGSLDTDFGTNGLAVTPFGAGYDGATSVVVQPDGKIVAVGYTSWIDSDFALVRYNADGSLDTSWGINGKVITDFNLSSDYGNAVVLQPDGKIVAIGGGNQGDFAIARYISGLVVGVIDIPTIDDVLIYPNPVQQTMTLEYTLDQDETLSIKLYDISGQLIQTLVSQSKRRKGTNIESLHLDDRIIPGIYFLCISTSNGALSLKIIKP